MSDQSPQTRPVSKRDVRDYTIEVCIECGAQLSRNTTAGRCPNRDHWSRGGIVVRVMARPVEQQDQTTRRHWKAVASA